MRRLKFLYLFLLATLVLVLYVSFGDISFLTTRATENENQLRGWAWSSNIGWISLSCKNDNCGTSNYQVKMEPFDPWRFSGYAWSSNIGWIRFDPPEPYPLVGPDHSARLVPVDNIDKVPVKGWIRACAVFQDPAVCSGALSGNNGAWDGWIKMSGGTSNCPNYHETPPEAGPYETCMTAGYDALDGWAWGGELVGWIEFKPGPIDEGGNEIFVPSSSIRFCETRPTTAPGSDPTCPQ